MDYIKPHLLQFGNAAFQLMLSSTRSVTTRGVKINSHSPWPKKSSGMCFVWLKFPDSSKLTAIKGRRWTGADVKPGSFLLTALLLYLKT